MTIEVKRGARTATGYTGDGWGATISVGLTGNVNIKCFIPVSGGDSEVCVRVKPDSFEELVAAMMKANRNAAIKAFCAVLQSVEG